MQKLLNGEHVTNVATSATAKKDNVDLYAAITDFIVKHGFAAHIKGYAYTRTALMIMIQEPALYDESVTILYRIVGERHNTTGSRVERAIRHSITRAFDLHPELFTEFANTYKAPTNGEFLCAVTDILKRQLSIS